MKLVKYKNIDDSVLQLFHNNDVFIHGDDNMFLLEDSIEVFEYPKVVDIYFDRCSSKNYIEYINFVEKKFKRSTNVYISTKNPCVNTILSDLEKQGYGCPRIVSKSLNKNIFKTEKIIVTNGCLNHTELDYKTNDDFNFGKKDVAFFKSLLMNDHETGGIIKKQDDNYKIIKKSLVKGSSNNIDLEISEYNFHTHPLSVYEDNFAGWFSGDDIKYIIYNSFHGLKEHFLITLEGVYRLSITPEFRKAKKNISSKQLDEIVEYIYNMFVQLEDKRHVDGVHKIGIDNKKVVRTFNDFFVIVHSITSKWFKLKGNYRLLNLEFKKWYQFK